LKLGKEIDKLIQEGKLRGYIKGEGARTNDDLQKRRVRKITRRIQRKDTPLIPSQGASQGEASLVHPKRNVCAR